MRQVLFYLFCDLQITGSLFFLLLKLLWQNIAICIANAKKTIVTAVGIFLPFGLSFIYEYHKRQKLSHSRWQKHSHTCKWQFFARPEKQTQNNKWLSYTQQAKGQLISKGLFGALKSAKKKEGKIRLYYSMISQVDLFSFIFGRNRRHQKDISKLTDLQGYAI